MKAQRPTALAVATHLALATETVDEPLFHPATTLHHASSDALLAPEPARPPSVLRRQLLRGDLQHAVRVQGQDVDVPAPRLTNAEDHILRRRHAAELPEPAVERQRLAFLIGELG